MMDVVLRDQLQPSDRDSIAAITASSGFFSPLEVDTAVEVYDEAISKPTSTYRFLIAEREREMVGYACWGKDLLTESSYELYWIAVASEQRSHGIGTILLDAVEFAIGRIDPNAQLFIETAGRDQYLPTRIFYQRHGYHQVAWLTDYYSAGDAKVIYAKKLPGACATAAV